MDILDKLIHDLNNQAMTILYMTSPGEGQEMAKINNVAKEQAKTLKMLEFVTRDARQSAYGCTFKVPESELKQAEFGLVFHCDVVRDSCEGCGFKKEEESNG